MIPDRRELVLVTKEDFEQQLNVKIHLESEVVAINREHKFVTVKDLVNDKVYEESYTHLVLSPGGYSIKPHLPGINDRRIFTSRTLDDMDAIKKLIDERKPKKAVVLGAGFVGLEVAENLHNLGLMVSIVEFSNQVMNLLDYEMASFIHHHQHSKNIELFLNDGVKEFKGSDKQLHVILQSGRTIKTDMAILAMGIKPEVKLAREAGLALGEYGGIKVDEFMCTNDSLIYALGDATEIVDTVSGHNLLVPLANSAHKQGRIIADNICGAEAKYKGTPGTLIVKVFDMAVAMTGNSEKQLLKQK